MIKKALKFIKKWFWDKQISPVKKEKKQNIPAAEIADIYEIIEYRGEEIQLLKNQVEFFNNLPSGKKKQIVTNFQNNVKKGRLKKVEINGHKRYVKTRGYDYSKYFGKQSLRKA